MPETESTINNHWSEDDRRKLKCLRIDPTRSTKEKIVALVRHFKADGGVTRVTQMGDPVQASQSLARKIRGYAQSGALDWVLAKDDSDDQSSHDERVRRIAEQFHAQAKVYVWQIVTDDKKGVSIERQWAGDGWTPPAGPVGGRNWGMIINRSIVPPQVQLAIEDDRYFEHLLDYLVDRPIVFNSNQLKDEVSQAVQLAVDLDKQIRANVDLERFSWSEPEEWSRSKISPLTLNAPSAEPASSLILDLPRSVYRCLEAVRMTWIEKEDFLRFRKGVLPEFSQLAIAAICGPRYEEGDSGKLFNGIYKIGPPDWTTNREPVPTLWWQTGYEQRQGYAMAISDNNNELKALQRVHEEIRKSLERCNPVTQLVHHASEARSYAQHIRRYLEELFDLREDSETGFYVR